MYEIVYRDGEYWIAYNGRVLDELGSFIEPISPKRIIEEIKYEV